mmetsp:Transcript_19891/g.30728  ORF Transcript_19891/g.30728 Transcript_19891/m.30728 type:complete len:338 (+) Transcript_19891:241-1254(+)
MPLSLLLKTLDPGIVFKALGGSNSLEHILDSRHHTLKTTEINVGTVLKLLEDFVSVFLDLVLDVHLSTGLVFLLTGKGVVNTKTLLGSQLEFVIVEKSITVGNTKEQPGLSLVGSSSGGVLGKKTTDESTVGGNSGTGGNHNVIGGGVFFGHKHDLTSGSSHLDFVTGGSVTQKVRADTLLGGIVGLKFGAPVGGTTDTKRTSLSGHIITVTGRSDGVKTDRMGLSVLLVDSRGDNTPRLTLPVGEVTIVIDNDVASLTSGLGSDNALGGNNLSSEGSLVLPHIDRDGRLVIVRLGLKEIFGLHGSAEGRLGGGGKGRSRCNTGSKDSKLHLKRIVR